ncbi:MAG: hypothetical protein AB7R77_12715 [Ilumatobacteraceae bacterium]
MANRMYTVSFENVSISAAQDLFEITPADDKPVAIAGLFLSNVGGTADAGDAQEELLRLAIIRGFTTSGSGGSAPTPAPCAPADSAAGFTAEVNNTTLANTGTTATLHADGWNVRVPYGNWWIPEAWIWASQANTTIVVRLVGAPADAVSCSGTLYVIEA